LAMQGNGIISDRISAQNVADKFYLIEI
jgi:hypothetical protein